MSKNIYLEYYEEESDSKPFYTKRKIASNMPQQSDPVNQGMGSGFVAVPKQAENLAQDIYFSEGNADYAKDSEHDKDESLDILGRGDMHGVIGHSEDPEEYQYDEFEDYQPEGHFHSAEEEVYQESDGHVHHEGEQVIEGDAEQVLQEIGKKIPGVEVLVVDEDPDDKEEDKETDWENDRDPNHFMVYITKQYPSGIPKHDGTSTLGCERAILFLNKLNKEISEALRADSDDVLDIPKLEDIRVNLVKDTVTLQNHVKDLNKKRKRAEVDSEESIVKTASTPKIQLIMTPFERAISGIITNAVVSSGKPFEDVYEFLKKKYSLDEREELAIMQILKDMGHPIFKDRGTIGKGEKKEEGYGVEFIKNYLA